MTKAELLSELKGYKMTDHIYLVKNWSRCDEDGNLSELAEITSVTSQRIVIDMGLDFEDETQILLEAEGVDDL